MIVGALGVLSLTAVAGCGGSQGPSASAADQDRARAAERLLGRWLLVEYRPDQPLEPMLGALLGAQIGRLTATFDGQMLTAEGTGFRTQRAYSVMDAAGDGAHLVLRDPAGVTYDVLVTFRGPELNFQARTSPWQGTGRLQRVE